MIKCAICREEYQKWSLSQKVCGKIECAQEHAKIVIAKIERRDKRIETRNAHKRWIDLQPRKYWVAKCKLYFHRYIRQRDKNLPCISCGKPPTNLTTRGGSIDAGHFRSVGSAKHLEFSEFNVHAQCKKCNRQLSGNHSEYRKGLIERFGILFVENLEADQIPRKFNVPELQQMTTYYKSEWNKLPKE